MIRCEGGNGRCTLGMLCGEDYPPQLFHPGGVERISGSVCLALASFQRAGCFCAGRTPVSDDTGENPVSVLELARKVKRLVHLLPPNLPPTFPSPHPHLFEIHPLPPLTHP